jgi:hypothetical protein
MSAMSDDNNFSHVLSDAYEYKYCVGARVPMCEFAYLKFMRQKPVDFVNRNMTPVHCANPDCHGIFFVQFDGQPCSPNHPPRCSICRDRDARAAEKKRECDGEDAENDSKRQRTELESDEGRVFVILESVTEKGRVVKAHFEFENRETLDYHENTMYEHLIGSFAQYCSDHCTTCVKKGKKCCCGPDDVIEGEFESSRRCDVVDPIFVTMETNS